MNVLRQNLLPRVLWIAGCTALVCLAFYFLEYSSWAESIRQPMPPPETPPEPRQPPGYGVMLAMSLTKAAVMIGVPLLLTLGLNRIRLWLLGRYSS